MADEINNAANVEAPSDAPAAQETTVETQQPAPQAAEQADTTPIESRVSSDLEIQAPEESETSEVAQPSIDDIVEEALSGEISEETQKLITDNGLDKHITMLVEGHKAIQEKNSQEIFNVVGGKESYGELQEWAKNSLSKEEQETFNGALFSGNLDLAKLAVEGLQSRYVAKNGKAPSMVLEGGGSANEDSRPFSGRDEYLQETRSLKYKQDPNYRKQVEAKRNLSGF